MALPTLPVIHIKSIIKFCLFQNQNIYESNLFPCISTATNLVQASIISFLDFINNFKLVSIPPTLQ